MSRRHPSIPARPAVRMLLVLVAGLTSHAPAFAASVCRVAPNGTAGGSGTWTAPMDLQSALGNAACDEVWVKTGTYKPTTGTDRNISFTLDRAVAVYGGFAGNETLRSQRNPNTRITVLSGDIGTPDVASDNSYHVVQILGDNVTKIDATTVLDGFTITAGRADGATVFTFNGGGLLCLSQSPGGLCSPTLRQLHIADNHASVGGGGIEIYCEVGADASPAMSELQVSSNTAGSSGGGLELGSECKSILTLERSLFQGNSAGYGGAMTVEYGNGVTLRDVDFANNDASQNGGAMYNDSLGSIVFERTSFDGNTAGALGGAMYNRSGVGTSAINITDTLFNNNSALATGGNGQGGAMHNETFGGNISLLMNRVTLSNNQADFAGAIHNTDSYVGGTLTANLGNVTFRNNTATTSSRDMTTSASYTASDVALRNVTMDSSSTGYYALVNTSSGSGSVHLTLSNVILWDATPSLPIVNSGAATSTVIDHSIVVRSNGSGSSWRTSLGTDGGGNIDADPLLGALGDNGGWTPTMLPTMSSPAIDAASAATCAAAPVSSRDQRGGSRPHGPGCDIGAVEVGADVDMIFANGFD